MFRGLKTMVPAAVLAFGFSVSPALADAPKDVLKNYADIAQAGYEDSLETAKTMQLAIDAFLENPTEPNLRAAWIAARPSYMQTEAYRFGNPIVDDWEGKVNAGLASPYPRTPASPFGSPRATTGISLDTASSLPTDGCSIPPKTITTQSAA